MSSPARLAAWAAAVCLLLPASAAAATWQVTSTSDGVGVCPDPASCTLRAAITHANADPPGDVVDVPTGHYHLTTGAVPVTTAMQIVGTAGPATTTIEQDSTTLGIFSISSAPSSVTVGGLTLTSGNDPNGGAIASQAAALTLSNDVFIGNGPGGAGPAGNGGAVNVSGSAATTLTVTGSTFNGNRAGGDGTNTTSSGVGSGGAISFGTPGTLTVADSAFNSNKAGGSGAMGQDSGKGDGGAIMAGGISQAGNVAVTVTRTVFNANTAGGAGAVGTFSGNGNGGAIELAVASGAASLSVTDSTFSGNVSGGTGGSGFATGVGSGGAVVAFDNNAGQVNVDIARSTFSANLAGGQGGSQNDAGQGTGGGVEFATDTAGSAMAITNSTFDGNRSGGTAGTGQGSGDGVGGGVATLGQGSLSLLNDTMTGGNAGGQNGSGGNLATTSGGGSTTAKNTILADGIADTGSNCRGPVTSLGHNIETANDCGLTASGDRPNTAPSLGALGDNGGPTLTRAALPGSPAIDGGDSAGCPATDQRGVLRPAGASCEVGAFEIATPGATTGAASSISGTSATLNGLAFNPDLGPGSASFQYGTSTAYGNTSAPQPLAAVTAGTPLSLTLNGLGPGTTYHFRVVASNAIGTSTGADQTFTTPLITSATGGGAAITQLKLSPSRIVAAPGHGASAAAARKKRTGATLSFRASEAGITKFTIQRPHRGYRSRGRCVAKKPHGSAKPRRCTLYTSSGSFSITTLAGANRRHFTGRGNRKPLAVGAYRLQAVETAHGHKGKAVMRSFRIVR